MTFELPVNEGPASTAVQEMHHNGHGPPVQPAPEGAMNGQQQQQQQQQLQQQHQIDNPTPHRLPEGENATPLEVIGETTVSNDKLVIVMVGLPATGTFLCMCVCVCVCV